LEQVPITKEGYEALKKELAYLKKVERPKNIKAIEDINCPGQI
jgi:transcription elongation factor GreA